MHKLGILIKCNEECDILIKFTNRNDPYYYCIKDEIFNAIYHRFLPEDFHEFGFSSGIRLSHILLYSTLCSFATLSTCIETLPRINIRAQSSVIIIFCTPCHKI
nr:DUF3877 family protein [Eubacterium ventriosum]